MKTIRYTEAQIIAILRQSEGGMLVVGMCRGYGINNGLFYQYRGKYGRMDASSDLQVKAIGDESRRLKRMYADLSMQTDLLEESLGKR